jgi:hypothetical protein
MAGTMVVNLFPAPKFIQNSNVIATVKSVIYAIMIINLYGSINYLFNEEYSLWRIIGMTTLNHDHRKHYKINA